MSMHKIPLTPIEEAGLRAHGLDIGTPSQLSDAFRQGVRYGRAQPIQGGEAVEVVAYRGKDPDGGEGFVGARWPDAFGEDCIVERLMTVAQHQRILAAANHPADQVADGVVVSRELKVIEAELSRITHDPFTSTYTSEELAAVLIALRALLNGGRS